jgi:cell division septation protein DedD
VAPPETLKDPLRSREERREGVAGDWEERRGEETTSARVLPDEPPIEKPDVPPVENASLAVPPGNGWVVQVGAYPRRTAEGVARGLAAKGYPSFVMPRERGLFAVRVGKYTDRREADAVMLRLEQDEQFKNPWITR